MKAKKGSYFFSNKLWTDTLIYFGRKGHTAPPKTNPRIGLSLWATFEQPWHIKAKRTQHENVLNNICKTTGSQKQRSVKLPKFFLVFVPLTSDESRFHRRKTLWQQQALRDAEADIKDGTRKQTKRREKNDTAGGRFGNFFK